MNLQEYKEYDTLNDGAICSFYFLEQLEKLFRKYQFKRILEIGVGMGTMPHFLRHERFEEWVGTESLDFCIEHLKVNAPYVKHNNDISTVKGTFDLIIVDGRDNLTNIPEMINKRGIILVEGNRGEQVKEISSHLSLSLLGNTYIIENVLFL